MSKLEGWWWCTVTEDEREPPDFSKVPEDRLQMVMDRWVAANPPVTKRWKLWGPQIPLYERTEGLDVRVIEPVEA